jgi:hypothetical protein
MWRASFQGYLHDQGGMRSLNKDRAGLRGMLMAGRFGLAAHQHWWGIPP